MSGQDNFNGSLSAQELNELIRANTRTMRLNAIKDLREAINELRSSQNLPPIDFDRPRTIANSAPRKLSKEQKKWMTAQEIQDWKARERRRRKAIKAWAHRARDAAIARELREQEADANEDGTNNDGSDEDVAVGVLMDELEALVGGTDISIKNNDETE